MEEIFNIAIDGPSGSGKTSVAKEVAKRLEISYLDTGAMYRGMAYFCAERGIDVRDEEAVKSILDKVDMEVLTIDGEQMIYVNKKDVTPFIRTPEISFGASTVSKIKEVRLKMVELQRKIAGVNSCILDGRDIGSFVLPEAKYKFYFTAEVDERAKRRYLEIKDREGNEELTLEKVKEDMIARDEQDSKRAFAPLVIPEGAEVIDTTHLTFEEVVDRVLSKVVIE